MTDTGRFAVYFSHSWRPRDVDLNLQVWDELARDCELLVDEPDEPGADPPYYINRIEELFRRTDFFVSVLTYREPNPGDFEDADAQLRCSPYALFEIRLAERADMPRLVLYEPSTGFGNPATTRSSLGKAYVEFDRGRQDRLPERGQWDKVVLEDIRGWITWAAGHHTPIRYKQSKCAAILAGTSRSDPVCDVIEASLKKHRYEPTRLDPSRQRSSEAFRLLHEAGLVVADFGTLDEVGHQLYAAAHGLGTPAIRMRAAGDDQGQLPWILRGHPGGYQHDIVGWSQPADLPTLLEPRIAAMSRLASAKRDGEGADYLQSKRYSQFFVFISHTLKPPHREVADQVYALLKKRLIKPFEYHQVNTAGMDWRSAMTDALEKTTHFIALLSPDYEQSQTCMLELETILARKEPVSVLPFMLAGRDRPNPKLGHLHNRLLSDPDPRVNAQVVVDEVMAMVDATLENSIT